MSFKASQIDCKSGSNLLYIESLAAVNRLDKAKPDLKNKNKKDKKNEQNLSC